MAHSNTRIEGVDRFNAALACEVAEIVIRDVAASEGPGDDVVSPSDGQLAEGNSTAPAN